jgi:aryl-alcohol dehydrogenase-like predicted oxidoreductase
MDKRRLNSLPIPPFHEERTYEVSDILIPMAEQKSVTVSQLSLAWLLYQQNEMFLGSVYH